MAALAWGSTTDDAYSANDPLSIDRILWTDLIAYCVWIKIIIRHEICDLDSGIFTIIQVKSKLSSKKFKRN